MFSPRREIPPIVPADRRTRAAAAAVVLLILALFAWRLFDSIPGNSVTYDESVHVTRGYAVLRYHDPRLNVEHPLLGDALAAIPLAFKPRLHFPLHSEAWTMASHWVIADQFLWHDNHRPQYLVDLARYSVAVMSILLGLLVALWSAELYGWAAGIFSLLLYSFCPTVIANSILATNDLSLALFSTLSVWALWRFTRHPTLIRGAAAAIALAAAMMCKYSGLVLIGDTGILLLWWWWRTGTVAGLRSGRAATRLVRDELPTPVQREDGILRLEDQSPDAKRRARASDDRVSHGLAGGLLGVVGQGLAILAAAGFLIWAAYGFVVSPIVTPSVMKEEVGQSLDLLIRGIAIRPDDKLIKYPKQVMKPIPPLPHNLRWRVLTGVPVPAPQYVRGLLENWMQTRGGHLAFLMGKISRRGWWYYFPVAFLVKTPIPYLLILGLAFVSLRKGWKWDEAFLLVPIALLGLLAMKAHMDIGIRHLLPIYPLLAIFSGRLIVEIEQLPTAGKFSTQLIGIWTLAALCVWFAIEGAMIHPLYLTYFNQLAGGPDGGSRFLVDSNLDWGQDLIRLRSALAKRNISMTGPPQFIPARPPLPAPRVWKNPNVGIGLAYFGTAEPTAYGLVYQPLDTEPSTKPVKGLLPFYGWLAVSVSDMAYHGYPGGGLYWLHNFKPEFTVGHTIRVYHIHVPRVKRREVRKLIFGAVQMP